ncbi:unnamed protein product [Ixodes pacificus]
MSQVWSVDRKRSIPVVRLPELSVLVLGRHLNDPGFVNDACGAAALLNDADDPGLVALLLLNVLAVCSCLLSGQADQQAPCKTSDINAVIFKVSCLGTEALQELEGGAAGLGHGGHLGQDRQVVDDEGHLVLLDPGEQLRVPQEAPATHVRGPVGVVLVHQDCRCIAKTGLTGAVEARHGVPGTVAGPAHVLLSHDQAHPVPALGLLQPLLGAHRHLASQRLRQHQHVPHHRTCRLDPHSRHKLQSVAATCGASSDDEPRVEGSLSPRDPRARQRSRVPEPLDEERHDNVPLLVAQLAAHRQHQQNVVAVCHSMGVQAAQHAGAGYLALHTDTARAFTPWIQVVYRLYQRQPIVPERSDAAV